MTDITTQGGTGDVYIVKFDNEFNCLWYSRITMNTDDIIRDIEIDTHMIVSGITSVQSPVYETSYGKKFVINTPSMNNKRGFRIKIKM